MVAQIEPFIVELDDQRKWFRYHHLFQELLQAKLKEQKTDIEISRIHAHASNCFEQLNLIKEAIRHMLASGNAVEACNIVERHRMVAE